MEIKGEVPWQHPARFWRDADDAQLICYVDANYGNFSARNYQIGVAKVVDDRSYHPIREFFAGLPQWDGKSRVETLLIDYLGADDNAYTRAVTRKTICAGVARIKQPGMITGVFGSNLTYRTPELLSRPWFHEVDVSKYIAYFIAALNHDLSVSAIIDRSR